jgi:hypothetical protein
MLRIDDRGVGGPRTMLRRGHCLKRQLRKVIPGHWSGWAHLRKAGEAGRRIQALPKHITSRPRRSVMGMPRPLLGARNVPT